MLVKRRTQCPLFCTSPRLIDTAAFAFVSHPPATEPRGQIDHALVRPKAEGWQRGRMYQAIVPAHTALHDDEIAGL
jgi:hypothetical protein